MRALALHPDVLVVTSAVLQANCVIVRGGVSRDARGEDGSLGQLGRIEESGLAGETFIVDSPVLPDELDALAAVLEQARFPSPNGLLATHGDWDHMLGRLAYPQAALGCSETTAERIRNFPGEAQRQLREFDESLMIKRPRPLTLGSVQELPVPGRCQLGDHELELHPAIGHTVDGMAIVVPWAGVIVVGDYLSPVELPVLSSGDLDAYLSTLERLGELVANAEHVVPGHGPVLRSDQALGLLEEDRLYVRSLRERGGQAELPPARRTATDRRAHAANAAAVCAQNSA